MSSDTPNVVISLRAVLDTSVLVSDERHWLWLYAHDGYYEAVWSTIIVAELVRVRMRLATRQGVTESVQRRRIYNLVHQLSDVLTVADYRSILLDDVLPDPDDDPNPRRCPCIWRTIRRIAQHKAFPVQRHNHARSLHYSDRFLNLAR